MRRKFTDIIEFSGKACGSFDGKKNYISTGCVHEDYICENEIETVEYNSKPSRANLIVEPGDILFAKMQATKKTLLINEALSQNIYSTGFYAIKPKDGLITQKCLYYLINSSLFLDEKDKNCSGATQKAINNQGLSNIELDIPEFSVQKTLTQILDMLSKIIKAKQSQIDYLDSLIKARFVEMFGDIYKASKYPKQKWNDVVTIKNGKDYKKVAVSDGGYPVYGTGGEMARASEFLCPENTIIVGRKGTINNPLLVREKFWNVDTAFGVIPSDKLHYLYFFWFCKMFDFSRLNKQAVLPSTTKADLLNIEMQVPPIGVQDQFANFVIQVDKSKFAISQSLLLLTKILRVSIVPRPGQISVLLSSRDNAG